MRIEKSIDWMTATFKPEFTEANRPSHKHEWAFPVHQVWNVTGITEPTRYYERANQLEGGATMEFVLKKKTVKPHIKVNCAGATMRRMRSLGFNDSALVKFVYEKAMNCTRVDFAIDVFDAGSTHEILNAIRSGEAKTRSIVEHYEGVLGRKGHTVYLGSKESDLRLRIYNKAEETGYTDLHWIRIECQARKDYAWAMIKDMHVLGISEGGSRRVGKMLKAPGISWWNEAVNTEGKPSSGYDDTNTNWRKWVKDTVLPSLLDHAETDEDILAQVIYALQERLLSK